MLAYGRACITFIMLLAFMRFRQPPGCAAPRDLAPSVRGTGNFKTIESSGGEEYPI